MFSSEFNLKRSLLSLVTADYAVVKEWLASRDVFNNSHKTAAYFLVRLWWDLWQDGVTWTTAASVLSHGRLMIMLTRLLICVTDTS